MFAVGSDVQPEQVAAILSDLSDALGWDELSLEPSPPRQPRKARALPRAQSRAKRGRPTPDDIAAEIQRVAEQVAKHPRDGIPMRELIELVWPGQTYSSGLYARAHNRVTRCDQLGLVNIVRDASGLLTVFPARPPDPVSDATE